MKGYLLLLTLTFSCFYATAQPGEQKDSVIIGAQKYLPLIAQIIKKYEALSSSINSGDQKKSLDAELIEFKTVLQKFLKVKRVSAVNKIEDNNRRETIYFVVFEPYGNVNRIQSVKWTIRN